MSSQRLQLVESVPLMLWAEGTTNAAVRLERLWDDLHPERWISRHIGEHSSGVFTIPSRILIVDDHDVVRHGVRHILETQDDWEIAGEAENGREALRLVEELNPDAIVMDITMPVMNGLDATCELVKMNPNSRVLILTMHDHPSIVHSIQGVGAKGLLTKSRATAELTPALKAIIAGQTYFQ